MFLRDLRRVFTKALGFFVRDIFMAWHLARVFCVHRYEGLYFRAIDEPCCVLDLPCVKADLSERLDHTEVWASFGSKAKKGPRRRVPVSLLLGRKAVRKFYVSNAHWKDGPFPKWSLVFARRSNRCPLARLVLAFARHLAWYARFRDDVFAHCSGLANDTPAPTLRAWLAELRDDLWTARRLLQVFMLLEYDGLYECKDYTPPYATQWIGPDPLKDPKDSESLWTVFANFQWSSCPGAGFKVALPLLLPERDVFERWREDVVPECAIRLKGRPLTRLVLRWASCAPWYADLIRDAERVHRFLAPELRLRRKKSLPLLFPDECRSLEEWKRKGGTWWRLFCLAGWAMCCAMLEDRVIAQDLRKSCETMKRMTQEERDRDAFKRMAQEAEKLGEYMKSGTLV